MDLSDIKAYILANAERYAKKHGIEVDLSFLTLKLMEESGEFASALLASQGRVRAEKRTDAEAASQALASELADLFTTVVLLADRLHVDLPSALEEKALQKGRVYLETKE